MVKKLHAWLARESICSLFIRCKEKKEEKRARAKQLFFSNFGNYMTMKKNGEYKEYAKYKVSADVEYQWSIELRDRLVNELLCGHNLHKVWALTRINLPKSEIIGSFEKLKHSDYCNEILEMVTRLKCLIEPDMYERILRCFGEI